MAGCLERRDLYRSALHDRQVPPWDLSRTCDHRLLLRGGRLARHRIIVGVLSIFSDQAFAQAKPVSRPEDQSSGQQCEKYIFHQLPADQDFPGTAAAIEL